ncbi:uncharacterized protein V1510DRAFT_368202 [Dipodascopsis tothii]|uniref:uncharacterized protein n=1 Tax=Dipodascopsis tothii TaxID=44089 RepID=UPI0034CEB930
MLEALPAELSAEVLTHVPLPDVLEFSTTCRKARQFVLDNELLWRHFFGEFFDPVLVPTAGDALVDALPATRPATYHFSTRPDAPGSAPLRHGGPAATDAAADAAAAYYFKKRLAVGSVFAELKLRVELVMHNGPRARAQFATAAYRLAVREQVVDVALAMLREHVHKNFDLLSRSQLVSAVLFNQFLPGTLPSVDVEQAPSPTLSGGGPRAYVLVQKINLLRLIFAQRLSHCPVPMPLVDIQKAVYDSSRYPLFTNTPYDSPDLSDSSAAPPAGAADGRTRGDAAEPVAPAAPALSDSAFVDPDALFDPHLRPRFDTLFALMNFFVHYFERSSRIRDGLLPFFNTVPEPHDMDFRSRFSPQSSLPEFDFPKDWTGIYAYLTFWDFDLLQRSIQLDPARSQNASRDAFAAAAQAAAAAAAAARSTNPPSSGSFGELAPGSFGVPSLASPPSTATQPSSHAATRGPYHQAAISTLSQMGSLAAAPAVMFENGLQAGHGNTHLSVAPVHNDQFDGFQVMETSLPTVNGPVSFSGRGRDRFDYTTNIIVSPLKPVFGLPGLARVSMRKEYVRSEASADEDDEVIWEYNGIYVPGPKIILGRWRDGSEQDGVRAVEGPFVFFADEL